MLKNLKKAITPMLLGILLCMLVIPATAQEINGYTADKPLTTYQHDSIRGGLFYTTGDSYYSGKLHTGDTYTVYHMVDIPESAVVKFARLYNYWTWGAKGTTGIYPTISLTFDGIILSPEIEYDDRKGWGIYDYPGGTWAYDITDYVDGIGSHTVVIENTGPDGDFFCMDGIGLLVVYTDETGKDIEYWINEGCDILNSQMEDDVTSLYETSPEETVTEMMTPTISDGIIKAATLWTIIQSGNWDANNLQVNDMIWTGICDGTPHPDLDVDVRDITGYLVSGTNSIRFQAVGDYAAPSGSFLVVEMEATTGEISMSVEPENTVEATSETKDSPGFEAVTMFGSLLVTTFLISRRYRER
ncbi:MAG: DUF3344 domain-containing protein [Methanosarcinaceae archaeon]|nr:DUF3344 domain-containing protein [Methanosarcinaceae archaeon]